MSDRTDNWNLINHPSTDIEDDIRNAFATIWWQYHDDRSKLIEAMAPRFKSLKTEQFDRAAMCWAIVIDAGTPVDEKEMFSFAMLDALQYAQPKADLLRLLIMGEPWLERINHMTTSLHLIKKWIGKDDQQHLGAACRMLLDRGLSNACRSTGGVELFELLLKEAWPCKLDLIDWVKISAVDDNAMYCEQALDILLAHGADVEGDEHLEDGDFKPLTRACMYLEATNGLHTPSKNTVDWLITAGARWDNMQEDAETQAWHHIQQHPRVRSARLAEIAKTTAQSTAVVIKPKF